MSQVRYATVALSLPFKFHSGGTEGLSYTIPPELAALAHPGVRVLVPLGRKLVTGVLVAVSHLAPEVTQKLRAIDDILDPSPIFDEQFLEWTKWIAKYYMASWGDVLQAALPEGLKPETSSRVVLDHPDPLALIQSAPKTKGKRRIELLEFMAEHPEGRSIAQIQKALKANSVYAILHALEQEGVLHLERPLVRNAKARTEQVATLPQNLRAGSELLTLTLTSLERTAPRQANILLALLQQTQTSSEESYAVPLLLKAAGATQSTLKALHEKGLIVLERRPIRNRTAEYQRDLPGEHDIQNLQLTEEQRYATKLISEQVRLGEHKTFLLHGVTGSGKTEVYTSVAQEVLAAGNGVLILVPEIALTPQLIDRFKSRLSIERDEDIAVLHSKLSIGERSAAFRSLVEGRAHIAIGARSAVFAPIRDLRLIIVDEEHEGTFKQFDKAPRYNARDAAVVRASILGAVAVLGSATPSIESYQNALEGKYELLTMKERAKRASLPPITIIDQRRATNRPGFDRARTALTPELQEAIRDRLKKKEGIVLFQNRRGFSTYLECTNCGEPEMCPNCAVTMTYHRAKSQMQCHYCGYYTPKRTTCAVCGSEDLRLGGLGTERVQEDIQEAFPDAKIERMDLDTTARKGSFKRILTSFASGESDILLGTQMVAKGLDFPRVSLVGVISADTSLCLPDFRASERTFQLLSQVAGRAGRSEELPGEVFVQSLQPGNRAIVLASQHDYEQFFQLELADRRILNYPPFSRLILIEFRGLHEQAVKERAIAFGLLFPERGSFYERIGPAAPSIPKLRNEYRYHILLKDIKRSDPSGEKIRRLITGALDQYQDRFASNQVKVTVDVDVQGVM